ncbi:MAG: hypothetical protein H7A46_17195 [Verrucomicrobiales bacterium]|nr:hypothetical protein [Verrucomicrobiales bacterium]
MGGIGAWFAGQWFDFVQSVGIVAGLVFTAVTLRRESRERRAGHLVDLTKLHRHFWLQAGQRSELARLLDPSASLREKPVTAAEQLFVNLLIVHLSTVWDLVRTGNVLSREAVMRDVRTFFSLPVPRAVWEQTKAVRDEEFVSFVDSCLPPVVEDECSEPTEGGAVSARGGE